MSQTIALLRVTAVRTRDKQITLSCLHEWHQLLHFQTILNIFSILLCSILTFHNPATPVRVAV
jgi:hypothetical protein